MQNSQPRTPTIASCGVDAIGWDRGPCLVGLCAIIRLLQKTFRERKNIGVGNVFLIDRTKTTRSSKPRDVPITADRLDLTDLVHQRTVRMACRAVRSGDQHRTVESAQSKMRHEPAELHEYVETRQVEVSPKRASTASNSLR